MTIFSAVPVVTVTTGSGWYKATTSSGWYKATTGSGWYTVTTGSGWYTAEGESPLKDNKECQWR